MKKGGGGEEGWGEGDGGRGGVGSKFPPGKLPRFELFLKVSSRTTAGHVV